MSESPNELIPRHFAVSIIATAIADVRHRIHDHETESPDAGSLEHSRIRVFLEQTAVELRRAAQYIQDHDMSEDP